MVAEFESLGLTAILPEDDVRPGLNRSRAVVQDAEAVGDLVVVHGKVAVRVLIGEKSIKFPLYFGRIIIG